MNKKHLYDVGFLCKDGTFSVVKGTQSKTYEEAEIKKNKLQPNYKHRLEVKAY